MKFNCLLTIFLICTVFCINSLWGQKIKGTVTDTEGNPIVGANVYIRDTYAGTTTDKDGLFELEIENPDNQILVISFIGYVEVEKQVSDIKDFNLNIALKETTRGIDAVTITAGVIEASDRKKAVMLNPLDIVTTASSAGDIVGALMTMPGTNVAGEDGRLLVRGGEAYETKTFIDGMLVANPYTSKVPDMPSRGRFSPFLFKGTFFSTGGYSAEYGQALSSTLILSSTDIETKDNTGISLMTVGLGASHTESFGKASLSAELGYTNLAPYFGLVKQNVTWEKSPEAFSGNFIFKKEVGKKGLLKTFATISNSSHKHSFKDYEEQPLQSISMRNNNLYLNSYYKHVINSKTLLQGGLAYTWNNDDIALTSDKVWQNENSIQLKINITHEIGDKITLKYGAEQFRKGYYQDYNNLTDNSKWKTDYSDNLFCTFVEPDIRISKSLVLRTGFRYEYSSLLDKYSLAPRFSVALKTGKNSQISGSYGQFTQNPENDFLKFNHNLSFEKATHYILNYQYEKDKQIFRVETYYKDYDNLVTTNPEFYYMPDSYQNTGYGYAKGIELFWRDRATISGLDYWVSYSFIDSERKYRDFPEEATPNFVAKHNLSVVTKYYIHAISTQIGITYMYNSGRPYNDINSQDFMDKTTKPYNDLSMNISYITQLFDNETIIHVSINNVLGYSNIYGYRKSYTPNQDGEYIQTPIMPEAKRFLFLGIFLSID